MGKPWEIPQLPSSGQPDSSPIKQRPLHKTQEMGSIYIYDKVVVVAAAVVIVVTVVKVEMVVIDSDIVVVASLLLWLLIWITGGIRTSKASANAFSHCVNPIASLPKVAAVVKLQGTDHRRTTEKPTAATSHLLYETLPSCAQEGEKSDIPFGNLCSYWTSPFFTINHNFQ